MTCRNCHSYDPSKLPGYGYCKVAASPEIRAQFFHDSSLCWLGRKVPR